MPAIEAWEEQATTDPALIRAWWAATPGANVGIPLGGPTKLVAVDLTSSAVARWRASGFESGATLRLPSEAEVHVFVSEETFATFSPQPGVTVQGEGGWIAAPDSVLATGTVRGTLADIPAAPFNGERDFEASASRRMLPILDVGNRMPALTSTGAAFVELVTRQPRDEFAHARVVRRRIMMEALAAGMSRLDAASLAFGSSAGLELRERADVGQIWRELEDAELSLGTSAPSPVALLEAAEHELAESPWWGSQYVNAALESHTREVDRWMLLTQALGGEILVPSASGSVPATLEFILVDCGSEPLADPDRSVRRAVGTALGIEEAKTAASAAGSQLQLAIGWSAAEVASRVWVRSADAEGGAGMSGGDGHESTPWELVTALGDARDRLLAIVGSPPYVVRADDEAAARHARFRSGLSEFLDEGSAEEFNLVVRKAAALVAGSEGKVAVELRHELIALKRAEEWLGNLLSILDKLDAR